MKRILCLLICIMLAVSLVSCSSIDPEEVGDSLAKTFATDSSIVEQSSQAEDDEPEPAADPKASAGEANALSRANSYLKYSAFSYEGLIKQLEFEGFTHEEAVYGADNCGANWKEQAAKKAESYLKYSSFSYDKLIDQLEYEGFTHEQAVYGADKVYESSGDGSGGSAGQKNALEKAKSYLKYSAFSYSGLIKQLEYEGFSTEDATYAADNCGANWKEQAAKKAESYLKYSSFSRESLIDQLEYEGFTTEQAIYGVEQNGF